MRSSTHPELTRLHATWYANGRKSLPYALLDRYLTPFALAVWFCDDGHRVKGKRSGAGSFLYTHAFQASEVDFLASLLLRKFGIKTTIRRAKVAQRFIYIRAESWPILAAALASAEPAGMHYKYK